MRLNGKHAVVTGAASGLGQSTAELMAQEGATVIVADIDDDRGNAVADGIAERGGRVRFVHCDVAQEDDVIAAIDASKQNFGGFNVMHNNAGVQLELPLHETSTEQWNWVNDVNSRGTFWGCKHAVLSMRQTGGGSIVNTASALSLVADPFLPAYTASKHAVLGLTRAVGVAYAADGIRCNCVCPGDMETPMIQRYWAATPDPEAARRDMEAAYPAKQIGQPVEVARAVVFLASDDASYINGTFLSVDGALLSKVY